MKGLITSKMVVGVVSSTAITGALLMGLDEATSTLPAHWFIEGTAAAPPFDVRLLSEQMGGYACEWLDPGPVARVARCPHVLVTAQRHAPGSPVVATAAPPDDGAAAQQLLAHPRPGIPSNK